MATTKDLFEQIEAEGWSVANDGDHEYRVSKFSPAGQDFSIVISGETVEQLIDSIESEYEYYDPSEQAYYWLNSAGHGTNGAPDDMADVVADMKACEKMIGDLLYIVRSNDLNSSLIKFYRKYKVKVISTADAEFRMQDNNLATYEPVNFHHDITHVVLTEKHHDQRELVRFDVDERFTERDIVRALSLVAKEVEYDSERLIASIGQNLNDWPAFTVLAKQNG